MKKFTFILLGLITSCIVYFSDISSSIGHFVFDIKHAISFAIVTISSSYAYYFIHKAFLREKQRLD